MNSLDVWEVFRERIDPKPPPPRIDRAVWLRQNLGRKFSHEFGPHHHWLMDQLGTEPLGVRAFGGAARGSGKSSVANVGMPIEAIAQGSHHYICIIKDSQKKAWKGLRLIRNELQRNKRLVDAYPNLRYVMTGGRKSVDQAAEIELVGGRIVALGAGESIRGLLSETPTGELVRPDLILFDDLEDPEQVRSKDRTDQLEEWLFADVAGLMGPGETGLMDIIGTGNTLGMDSLAVRAFSQKGRFSGWQVGKFPAEYRDDFGIRKATWVGQPLEWLDRLQTPEDPLFLGSITYATEYLLDPQSREDTLFQPQWLKYGKSPDWSDLRYITAGVDPAASEKTAADYSACCWVGLDKDYQVWVKRVWTQRSTARGLMDRVEKDANDIGRSNGLKIAFEAVGGFAWGVQMLRERGLATSPIKPQTDKISRATPVSTRMEGGSIMIDDSLRDSEFIRSLLAFPTGANDDDVDAFVHAERACTLDGLRLRRAS